MIKYTGTLNIDGVEFWSWAETQLRDKETRYSHVEFENEEVLFISILRGKSESVPAENLWSWISKYAPKSDAHEIVYGKPVWNVKEQTLDVNFAAGSEDPHTWTDKPEWMK